jgi:hypothetical protein
MNGLASHFVLNWLTRRHERAAPDMNPQARKELVQRAQRALRAGKLELSRSLLEECGDGYLRDPSCLNVLGLIAEAKNDWETARRCWGRAVRSDRSYQPARQNIRRHFELFNWGASELAVAWEECA